MAILARDGYNVMNRKRRSERALNFSLRSGVDELTGQVTAFLCGVGVVPV